MSPAAPAFSARTSLGRRSPWASRSSSWTTSPEGSASTFRRPERCARVGFPPSGSNCRSLASRGLFRPRFWHFSMLGKIRFGEEGLERCGRSDFPPSGSNCQSLRSRSLIWPCFWRFFDFRISHFTFFVAHQRNVSVAASLK